jgi:hypothetical protein
MITTNRPQKRLRNSDNFIGKIRLVGTVRLLLGVALLSVTASVCSASATDVFIAQNSTGAGNGADCADALPVSWLNTAVNWGSGTTQIGPGTTAHLCGTFTGAVGSTLFSVQGSGSNGSPITVKFEAGAILTSPAWSSIGAIQIIGQSYVTLDGGTNGIIQNSDNGTGLGHAQNSKGVYVAGSSHIIVKNLNIANICQHTSSSDTTACQSSGVTDAGIKIDDNGPNSSFITITQNTIHDTYAGVDVFWNNSDHDFSVDHNTVSRANWSLTAGGIGTLTSLAITNNDLSCVIGSRCNWDDVANQFHHNGMIIDPGQNASIVGFVVSNNFIHDINTCTAGIFLDPSGNGGTPGVQIYNNVFYTTPGQQGPSNAWITLGEGAGAATISGAFILNNTVTGPGAQGLAAELTATVKNNIFASTTYGEVLFSGFSGIASDYNDFYNLSGGMAAAGTIFPSVSAWTSAIGFDTHSITSNPTLTSSFTLNAGSHAIGSGTNLTSLGIAGLNVGAPQTFGVGGSCGTGCVPRPSSGAWDIGAYPKQSITAQAPNPPSGLVAH